MGFRIAVPTAVSAATAPVVIVVIVVIVTSLRAGEPAFPPLPVPLVLAYELPFVWPDPE
jgi:hypothetical protein